MDFWNNKDKEYRLKMIDVYNEQIKDLIKIVPTFKIANATIHFDETSPHMHIVGAPVVENCTRGMKKQVGKSQVFNKKTLTEIQDKMRNACIKSYNKFYEVDTRLKEIDKEYRTTLINFAKYHLIMFAMAKIMEVTKEEQNQVALYLHNCIKFYE